MKVLSPLRKMVTALALMLSANAMAVTITVTTTEDQNGSDPSKCSLREAVKSINTNIAFGGCPAGMPSADNKIQLASGVYALTDELVMSQSIDMLGAYTSRWDGDSFGTPVGYTDPLTGARVSRITPLTTIKAATGKRIFNAAASLGGMELKDLILEGSSTLLLQPNDQNGGVVISSGPVSLDNVQILNGKAQKGGAIYLAGAAGLSLSNATLSANEAVIDGGAIAMDCSFNGSSVVRSVSIQRSLLKGNISGSGAGAVAFCGSVTAGVVASTFSANSSAASFGALNFADVNAPDATISLEYVTAAEHTNGYFLHTDYISPPDVSNSVLAGNTLNCLIGGVAACTSNDAGFRVITTNLAQLEAFGDFGGLTKGYLPKGPLLVDQGEPTSTGCAGNDQRNLTRNMGVNCDIGAFERLQLTAIDEKGTNVSGDDRIAYIDVLTNDTFGEDGTGIAGIFKPVDFEIDAASPAACGYSPVTVDHPKPRLKVDNSGGVTLPIAPIKCIYRVKDAAGIPVGAVATTVEVQITNIKPVAKDDTYLRRVGEASISIDILSNDDDDGDGIYASPKTGFVIMIKGSPPKNLAGVPLPDKVKTALGVVSGVEVDCDTVLGSTSSSADIGAVCFISGTLTYSADNNLSPFTEEFTYTVFDTDGGQSNQARVIINTDAPAPGSSGGSLDWLLLGLLAAIGLQRARSF